MWPKFSRQSVKAVVAATEIAQLQGVADLDTEYLLLGLLGQDDTIATQILVRLSVSVEQIKSDLQKKTRAQLLSEGSSQDVILTAQSKQALDLATKFSQQSGQEFVGTEHLLLGLLQVDEGLAFQVLTNLGVSFQSVNIELQKIEDGQ